MENNSFTTTLSLDVAPDQVFNAITDVRGWWSENIEGITDRQGAEFYYHYQDVHNCRIRITQYVADKLIVWHVLDNYFKFTTDKTEWIGTDIVFEINEREGGSELIFTHKGLQQEYECYNICRDAWTHYVQDSLKQLILSGKGRPTPKEQETVESLPPKDVSAGPAIHHRLLIEKPAEIIYEALTTQKGLAGWWTPQTIAQAEVGSVSRFSFGPDYFKELLVEDLKPYSRVKWRCLKGFDDWINTTMTFELEAHSKGTILLFHHEGWKVYSNEFASCSFDWALFFRSLKFLCETGKGFPYPEFNKT